MTSEVPISYRKRYYQQHRIKAIARAREWYFKNRDQVLEKHRKDYRNGDVRGTKVRSKLWYAENRDRALKRVKARYQVKKEEIREHKRRHPEQRRMHEAKRRAAKKRGTINNAAIKEWYRKVLNLDTVRCYYCRVNLTPIEVRFDHVVPLSKRGNHSVDNLCVSCQPCNSSKYNTLLQHWNRKGQQVLAL